MTTPFDITAIRADFPLLATSSNGRPLVYLDSGATTQKPTAVIEAVDRFYREQNANIHRGVYRLSQVATDLYEQGRAAVARFLNAAEPAEIIFTSGATDAINLVASCWGRFALMPGDEILVSEMEHHSNIVPWQMVAQATGAVVKPIPMDDQGALRMDAFAAMLGERTRIVSVTHLSNSLGTINDIKAIATLAHRVNAVVMADGAQWVAHHPTDVQALDVDFYAFSGHKLFGPTGIGALYGRRALLERMPPYRGGGDMIERVSFERTTYAPIPSRFEAGTPDIAGVVGLSAAIAYVENIGLENCAAHEAELLRYATEQLATIPGLRIVGTAPHKGCVVSFVLDDPAMSPIDLGTALDLRGIAVRTGHHCCQPAMQRMGVAGTTRISLALYNTTADIDAAVIAIRAIRADRLGRSAAKPAAIPMPTQQVVYPAASAPSPQAAADLLAADFALFDDRESLTDYLLDLGRELPPHFNLLKQVTPRIPGCMSEVYVVSRPVPGTDDHLEFVADANAETVRGLCALLQRLFSGQRAADILAFDVEAFFRRIRLDSFLSTQRRNGLAGILARLHQDAKALITRAA
jgi:cysteine desulfurase/selenocysteine lyase